MSQNLQPEAPARRKQSMARQIAALAAVFLVTLAVVFSLIKHEYTRAGLAARFDFSQPKVVSGAAKPVNLRALLKNTPQLYAQGKAVFRANCAVCHGVDGYGNGPRAAGLSPPPRNYHTGKFLYGTSKLALYHTITTGIPGSAMPSFVMLPPKQRMEVVHYIRHWIPNPGQDTPAQLAALPSASAETGPVTLPPVQPVPEGPHIPIALAMSFMLQAYPPAPPAPKLASLPSGPSFALGAKIYQARCATCHGVDGSGGVPVRYVWAHPWTEVEAASFQQPRIGGWRSSPAGFTHLVAHGLPGYMMPGFGTLTQPEMAAVYNYVKALAGLPVAAPPAGGKP